MNRIVVDADLLQRLHNLKQPLELIDSTGTILAVVRPLSDDGAYELHEPPIDEAELERRANSDEWFTTDEVIRHLETLE